MMPASPVTLTGVLLVVMGAVLTSPVESSQYRVVDTLEIDQVPSWFPVGFCLLTAGIDQYAAYYDQGHHMTVVHRRLPDRHWQRVRLPSKVGWDSHNYITMALDSRGDIHLAGNMHGVPLIYFRTQRPGDITTFARLPMTGKEEKRCTYPRFLKTVDETLLFMYRSGGSGNGRRFYNRYDVETKTWTRFFDTPLFEGEGKRNAYPMGPILGPAGYYHLVWVWRDTPDCATNHHLSHARSRDLLQWETASGRPLRLPLTMEQTASYVDPIPSGGGIINGCQRLVFDGEDRPIIAYHRRDDQGHMQLYVAAHRKGRWQCTAVTQWDREVPFSGRGAMPFIGIRLGEVIRMQQGLLSIAYRHRDYGSGRLVLDEQTLTPSTQDIAVERELPEELSRPTIAFEGIRVKMARDIGTPTGSERRYLLKWETLEAHHDRPRQPPLPPASTLTLVVLEPNS